MKRLSVIFVLLLLTSPLLSQTYQLLWSDEFNGDVLDPSVWTRETGGGGWGNNELQFYTDRDTNAYIENGNLVIQALNIYTLTLTILILLEIQMEFLVIL